jgi:hypothetical protein
MAKPRVIGPGLRAEDRVLFDLSLHGLLASLSRRCALVERDVNGKPFLAAARSGKGATGHLTATSSQPHEGDPKRVEAGARDQ